jgi:hypothetical protein
VSLLVTPLIDSNPAHRHHQSDLDASSQLNLALSKEVVELVTMGIRESVRRLQELKVAAVAGAGRSDDDEEECSSSSRTVATKAAISDGTLFQPPGEVPGAPLPGYRSNYVRNPPIPAYLYHSHTHANASLTQSCYCTKSSVNFSVALHGLLSGMGPHYPGECGMDRIAFDRSLNAQSSPQTSHMPPLAEKWKVDMHPVAVHGLSQPRTAQLPASPQRQPQPLLQPLALPAPPAEVVFSLLDKHLFRDYRPATFRIVCRMAGLTEEQHLRIISQPTRERLSEGGSGAFFFVCDGTIQRSLHAT